MLIAIGNTERDSMRKFNLRPGMILHTVHHQWGHVNLLLLSCDMGDWGGERIRIWTCAMLNIYHSGIGIEKYHPDTLIKLKVIGFLPEDLFPAQCFEDSYGIWHHLCKVCDEQKGII